MSKPLLLDLFCGRFGWSKAFAARGWDCIGVDLVAPPEIPDGIRFIQSDVLDMFHLDGLISISVGCGYIRVKPDFICASSPCEQFSVHGMKHFHPNPPYPEMGIQLFNHTRKICVESGLPYVMENVRSAQKFVGNANQHCGPFYVWGNATPPLMPQGITKGVQMGSGNGIHGKTKEEKYAYRKKFPMLQVGGRSDARK